MEQEVVYSGYTAEPSDYECADGQLATSINLINEEHQLKPLFQPKELFDLPQYHTVVFVHKVQVSGGMQTNYIVTDTHTPKVCYTTDGDTFTDIGLDNETIVNVSVIGNTLLFFTADAVWYVLWKDNSYSVLGNHLPELNMSFGLVGHPRMFSLSDSKKSTFDAPFNQPEQLVLISDLLDRELKEETQNAITATFMAKVNKFVRQQTVEQGRFCMPFFVRHALRLYDGSLTMYGPPVLMQPSTTAAPVITITDFGKDDGHGNYNNAEQCNVFLVAADLDYKILNPAALDGWSDIISSVDIFISQPLYNYNQAGKIKFFHEANNETINGKFIGRLAYKAARTVEQYYTVDGIVAREDCIPYYPSDASAGSKTSETGIFLKTHAAEYNMIDIMNVYFACNFANTQSTGYLNGYYFDAKFVAELPAFEAETQTEQISNCQNFYKLHTIELEELTDERTLIEVPKDYLQSLVNREHISDDYRTHDTLAAKYAQEYNRRINFAGVKRKLFQGWPLSALLAYKDTAACTLQMVGTSHYEVSSSDTTTYLHTVYVRVEENTSSYIVKAEDTLALTPYCGTNPKSHGVWLYYPNAGAKEMWIIGGNKSYNIKLEAHPFLNGAHALLSYEEERPDQQLTTPTESQDTWVSEPQKIYTSEVNNPFVFPVTGINTIGTGDIIGIASAAKALSQGQFGHFPLYAFTTEGVWALEVNSTGGYSAKQPITRDVCISSKSITQLDSAVLFSTARGIMLLTGSQAQCITDSIASETPFDVTTLPHMNDIHASMGAPHTTDSCIPMLPFLDFLRGASMIYDYVHQHIIVFNPTKTNGAAKYEYAYVYSLKSKQWGMMLSGIESTINSYPDALAMSSSNALVSFDDTDQTSIKALYVTRPLKLGGANILKTVSAVIQRGHFQKGNVTTALYGSRDLYNWYLVWTSQDHYLRGFSGTPYKYFRIVGTATLTEAKSILGASVSFETKYTNQLR